MRELTSQDAEFLFSALPILFLVSLLVASVGLVWILFRHPGTSGHPSGLPETANSAGRKRDLGGRFNGNVPPESLSLKDRLGALESFLDENPPEKHPPSEDSPPVELSSNNPTSESPSAASAASSPVGLDTQAPPTGEPLSSATSDEYKDEQLRNVVRHLKNQIS